MKSNPSSSTSSSGLLSRFDPSVILMPVFLGFLRAAPFVPFIAMFFDPDFGVTGDESAPNGWWLAPIGALGFWSVRWLPKKVRDPRLVNALLWLLGILGWATWMAIEPDWHLGDLLRDPMSLVGGRGYFAWALIITLLFWILTLRLAMDEREQRADGVRSIMLRSLTGVMAGIVIAAIIGGDIGDAGTSAGYIALPVALVSGIGAVGLSEMISTRRTAMRRGATVPGWERWGRTFLGSAAIVLVITFAAAIVLGPGFLEIVIGALAAIWNGIATVLLWIMYGVVFALFYIVRGIIWLINLFFDTSIQPTELPEMGGALEEEPGSPAEQQEPEAWEYASLARLAGIIAFVVVTLLIISRFIRFRQPDDTLDNNEERSSVFSGSLLREQMRNLFRRRGHGNRPRKLDLSNDPESVRESMLYLQVLAHRLGVGRSNSETPRDFTTRLGDEWPQLTEPLGEIRIRYESVRYGETDEDRRAVIEAWRRIWSSQKELPGASG